MKDDFPTNGARRLQLTFESVDAEWRQGVGLNFKGKLKINGMAIERSVVLWHDTAPTVVEMEIMGTDASVSVKNVWDCGDGVVHSWHNGGAMIVEDAPNGRRYCCNDGVPDDDFDDLIFRLERIS